MYFQLEPSRKIFVFPLMCVSVDSKNPCNYDNRMRNRGEGGVPYLGFESTPIHRQPSVEEITFLRY